jgi:hypothetical protein
MFFFFFITNYSEEHYMKNGLTLFMGTYLKHIDIKLFSYYN